jgi:hypothetical protein
MDLHKDLESFRLAQSVLRKDEVTDRVLDVVNQDARRVDDYLTVLNASQRGMRLRYAINSILATNVCKAP